MGIFSNNKKLQEYSDPLEKILDQPLYTMPGTDTHVTWADSVSGTLILGSTGSGKSSGPGKLVALSMLKAGYGICILCAKKDERLRWENYIKNYAPEREQDLIIFDKRSGLKFNFLQYEMSREGDGSGEIISAVDCLLNLIEQMRNFRSGGGGRGDEKYWENALNRQIECCILLLYLSKEDVTIENLQRLATDSIDSSQREKYLSIKDTLNSNDNIDPEARKEAEYKLNWWKSSNYLIQLLERGLKTHFESETDVKDFHQVYNYWVHQFPRIGDKGYGIVKESLISTIHPFLSRGVLRDQFAEGVSDEILPENIIKNKKIVIIDYPIREYGLAGIFAATIYKTSFQAATERRELSKETNPKPVSLFIDEYQMFCSSLKDSKYQTTARSSWVAVVYLTQSISNLYFVMGVQMPRERTKSLLGNLNLKYFCNNSDIDTNKWASGLIGEEFISEDSYSYSNSNESRSVSKRLRPRVFPDEFSDLRTGREENEFIVEGIVYKSGKKWGAKKETKFALVEFNQN